jgi:hypothetical protein
MQNVAHFFLALVAIDERLIWSWLGVSAESTSILQYLVAFVFLYIADMSECET